jgi:fructose-1,6-bisphosphatase I
VYIYPETAKSPKGKLRLLYECNPLAFIAEQAGGKASNGIKRIMDVDPKELHQRCPLYIGSRKMVEDIEGFLQMSKDVVNAPAS